MKKLLAWLMAVTLTFQLVTPVFAEEIEETQAATEAVEVETEAPVTEAPTTEPPVPETAAPEETSAPTESQPTTEGTETTETTASTEETTTVATEPTEETTEPTLDLLSEDENVIASGTCGAQGNNLTWKLTVDGTLTISGNGKMKNYEDAANEPYTTKIAPWYKYNKNTEIRIVVVETGVTSIGNYAFSECHNLTSVVLPDSIDSIGSHVFSDCISLKSILVSEENAHYASVDGVLFNKELTKLIAYPSYNRFSFDWDTTYQIPASVTSIGDYAFEYSLLNIMVIPDSVIDIGEGAFMGNHWLTSITIPKSITRISDSTFRYCGSLTSIVIPESVTSIGRSAFESCGSLTSITIPKSVTSIGDSAFWGCDDLTSVTIPGSVTSISDYAFWGCSSLTNVTIGEGVTSIGGEAFYGCSSLSSLKIPESVTKIESGAFQSSNLTNVEIPQNVVSIGDYAFSNCSSLTSFSVDERNAHYTAVDGVLLSKNRKELVVYPGGKEENIYKLPTGVTKVHAAAFHSCGNLTQIVLSGNVTSIGDGAFVSCDILTSVVIPKSVTSIGDSAFWGCDSLTDIYYGGSQRTWKKIKMGYNDFNGITIHYNSGIESPSNTEIRPVDTTALISGSKLTLTAWAIPDNKKVKANWSLAPGDEAHAAISSSGVLTAKAVNEVQNITVIATPTDGRPEARKEIQILPKITVKQAEKFNLFHSYSRVGLAITGGKVDCALLDGNKDFVLENENDHFYIRFANPDNPPAKPNTRATLQVFFPGSDTPATKTLTISTTNTAPKLKLNPTSSILNTTLVGGLTVEAEVLGTEDESLKARSTTKGVTASIKSGKLVVTLDTAKTTTATIYFKGNDWAKEVKLTHRITVTNKTPTVKFTAKGKLDVLNPESEIVYTPKLTNAAGTITGVQLTGEDAKLFNAEVVDGLVHLKLAESGENYSTKKTYKVMPIVTLLDKDITGPTLSVKVTQGAIKLAKIPNQTVSKSSPEDLTVNIKIISPANAEIRDVRLNAKTTAALRNALDAAGDIGFEADTVTFPASAYATLKPGRYTVILDVFPFNAASDAKPIQAKFTLTVQK